MRPLFFVFPWLLLMEEVHIQIKRDLEARSAHRLSTADTEADCIMQKPIFNAAGAERKIKLVFLLSLANSTDTPSPRMPEYPVHSPEACLHSEKALPSVPLDI